MKLFIELENEGRLRLKKESVEETNIYFQRSMDLRYERQTHELNVIIKKKPFNSRNFELIKKHFHDLHKREHGYAHLLSEPVEIVNLKVSAFGKIEKPEFKKQAVEGSLKDAIVDQRKVYCPLHNKIELAPIYNRFKIPIGENVREPAIIEQFDSTTVVFEDQTFYIDDYENLIIDIVKK